MKNWMKTIYNGFRDVAVIGDAVKHSDISILPQIDSNRVIQLNLADYIGGAVTTDAMDLIILDLDSIGLEKSKFLIFLVTCFIPQTPMVLVTGSQLSEFDHDAFMSSGQVLGIIELKNSIGSPGVMSA